MPRWHGVPAQFLQQGQARRDDDAVMPAARNVRVDVVFACTNEKHFGRIQEHSLGADAPLESTP